jgi:hypothetical protein
MAGTTIGFGFVCRHVLNSLLSLFFFLADLGGALVADLLLKDRSRIPIGTFCDSLDRLLGGGVQIGTVTEFCTLPIVLPLQCFLESHRLR